MLLQPCCHPTHRRAASPRRPGYGVPGRLCGGGGGLGGGWVGAGVVVGGSTGVRTTANYCKARRIHFVQMLRITRVVLMDHRRVPYGTCVRTIYGTSMSIVPVAPWYRYSSNLFSTTPVCPGQYGWAICVGNMRATANRVPPRRHRGKKPPDYSLSLRCWDGGPIRN
jgi:hypothetical protein